MQSEIREAIKEASITTVDKIAVAAGTGNVVFLGLSSNEWNLIFSAGIFGVVCLGKTIEIIINLKKLKRKD